MEQVLIIDIRFVEGEPGGRMFLKQTSSEIVLYILDLVFFLFKFFFKFSCIGQVQISDTVTVWCLICEMFLKFF